MVLVRCLRRHRNGRHAPGFIPCVQEPATPHGRRRIRGGANVTSGTRQRARGHRRVDQGREGVQSSHGNRRRIQRPVRFVQATGGTGRATVASGIQAGGVPAGTGRRRIPGLHRPVRELQPAHAVRGPDLQHLLQHHVDILGHPHLRVRVPQRTARAIPEQLLRVVRQVVSAVRRAERGTLHALPAPLRRQGMLQIRSAGGMHHIASHADRPNLHEFLHVQHRLGATVLPSRGAVRVHGVFGVRPICDHPTDLRSASRELEILRMVVDEQCVHIHLPGVRRPDDIVSILQAEGYAARWHGDPGPTTIKTRIKQNSRKVRKKFSCRYFFNLFNYLLIYANVIS
mmetsp:Transcript_20537/g.58373  ORF Transcript_20537/g.58373 Transcript_20537/m.58373 type:complete len:342 (-) Transcript_20537:1711-2736(-)